EAHTGRGNAHLVAANLTLAEPPAADVTQLELSTVTAIPATSRSGSGSGSKARFANHGSPYSAEMTLRCGSATTCTANRTCRLPAILVFDHPQVSVLPHLNWQTIQRSLVDRAGMR